MLYGGGLDVFADALADEWIDAAAADGAYEIAEGGAVGIGDAVGVRPGFDFLNMEESGTDAVGEVVEGVGGIVCPVHDLALDGFEGVAGFSGGELGGEVDAVGCPIEVADLGVVDEVIFGWGAGCV